MRLLIPLFLIAAFVPAQPADAQKKTREDKVRDDKKAVEAKGEWIYNDLPKAFAEAKNLASSVSDKVDDKLKAIAAEVRRMRPELKGFTMANLSCKSLSIDVRDDFDLIEGQKAKVMIEKAAAGKMDRIQLKVTPPKMGEITYETPCGKFLPILTPFKTKAGEELIIAIRVQPCNGGK